MIWLDAAGVPRQADPLTALRDPSRTSRAVRATWPRFARSAAMRRRSRARRLVRVTARPGRHQRTRSDRDPSGGQRLLIEAFAEYGAEGRLVTFSLDLAKSSEGWESRLLSRIGNVGGLFRLSLNTTKQYRRQEPDGARAGSLAALAVGRMPLSPRLPTVRPSSCWWDAAKCVSLPPTAPKRPRCGSSAATKCSRRDFDAAFIRVRPAEFRAAVPGRSAPGRAKSVGEQLSPRRGGLRGQHQQDASDRPRGLEPRALVDHPAGERFHRRDPHREAWQSDLHPIDAGARRHHVCSIAPGGRTFPSTRRRRSSPSADGSSARTTSWTTTSSPTTST